MANNVPPKLLILQPYLAPYRIDIYNELAKEFRTKVLFWFDESPDQKFDQQDLKNRIKFDYSYLKIGFRIKFKVFKIDLITHLFRFKPDIVLAHEFGFFTLLSIMLSNVLRYQVVINCDDSVDMAKTNSWFKNRLKKQCLSMTNGMVTVSSLVKALYEKEMNAAGKIVDHPIMHDDVVFREKLTEALPITREFREKHQLTDKKVLLYVGRLVEVKGLDVLLNSFSLLLQDHPEAHLVLVGEGPLEAELKAQANRLKLGENIHFTGRFDGLPLVAWYNMGDLFVLPSRFEPFGAVVNEALLAGLPVVCSDIAGSAVLIDDTNGLLVAPDQVESLCTAMKEGMAKWNKYNVDLTQVRASLMKETFKENSERLIGFLKSILKHEATT